LKTLKYKNKDRLLVDNYNNIVDLELYPIKEAYEMLSSLKNCFNNVNCKNLTNSSNNVNCAFSDNIHNC
jgi:ribose 5-phosphate isomerase